MDKNEIREFLEQRLVSHQDDIFDSNDRKVLLSDVVNAVDELISGKYEEPVEPKPVELFKVRVEWYDGSITRESVIEENEIHYIFDFEKYKSATHAPKEWCTKL